MGAAPVTFLCLSLALFAAAPARAETDYTTARLNWDPSTLRLIQEGGSFGRMIRLANREILVSYEWGDQIYVKRSADEGVTWTPPQRLTDFPYGSSTTPEAAVLLDGSVLLAYNERPSDGRHAYTIRICFSRDQGKTWGEFRTVFQAGTTVLTAAWEPSVIQLPGGEVQLYFSNGKPYNNWWQEISLMRSWDGGATWTEPERTIYRPQSRDGMAGPLLLNNGQLVIAIEDNGLWGNFKPAIVPGPGGGLGYPALETMPAQAVYVGAPYIRQLPTGETLMSVQNAEGRLDITTQNYANMVVYFGDSQARNFKNPTTPFPILATASALWNALFIKNGVTVTAISSTTLNGVFGLWTIDGYPGRPEGLDTGVRAVVNGAAGAAGAVAPGELVSLYGPGICPEGARDLRVTFNGIASPAWICISDTQINAVVPYDVKNVADAVVEYEGVRTFPFPLGLTDAAPELFLQPGGGAQLFAAHSDGTMNRVSNAALRGSNISLWLTGQGLVDGTLPYPKPRLPVRVKIGGVDAPVVAANVVTPGALQLSVQVPNDAPRGDSVEVSVTVGSTGNRQRATLAIR